MTKKIIRWFGFTLLVAQALNAARPNVVMILIDDVGTGWIPPYADRLTPDDIEPEILRAYAAKRTDGRPVDPEKHLEAARSCMPYLAGLAKGGAVFDRCFATASLCAPSRAGLLTGTFQQRWGAYWNMDIDNYGVPADRVVLAEPLSAVGYRCGMIGKWHIATKDPAILQQVWTDLGGTGDIPENQMPSIVKKAKDEYAYQSSSLPGQHPLDRGFDYYFGYNSHDSRYFQSKDLWENHARVPRRPEGELLTDLFNQKACSFVEDSMKEKMPFFLYYAPMTLHGAIHPPPAHYSEQFHTGVKFSNVYAGHLLALDDGIQKIFQTLEKYGQAENTLFILSADNGCTTYSVPPYNAPNRGGKGTGWLGGMNVPFVVYQSGVVMPGIYNDIVSLADVMPTILETAGADVPTGIDGKSLLPLLKGTADKGPRDSLVSCGIHSSHWSYFYEGDGDINYRDGPVSPMYAWVLKGDSLLLQITPLKPGIMESLPDGLPARTLLYDLSTDRQQRTDLHAQYPERTDEFKTDIQQWLQGMPEPLCSQQQDYRLLCNGIETVNKSGPTISYQDDFSGPAGDAKKGGTVPELRPVAFVDAASNTKLDGSGWLVASSPDAANANYRMRLAEAPFSNVSSISWTVVLRTPTDGWVGAGLQQNNRNGLTAKDVNSGPWVQFGADGAVTVHGGSGTSGSENRFDGQYVPGEVITAQMVYSPRTKTVDLSINQKTVIRDLAIKHQDANGNENPIAQWAQIHFNNQPADGAGVDSFSVKVVP